MSGTALKPPSPRTPHRILAVRLPWWPTERLFRHRPETRLRPFVTVAESRGRPIIDAANPRAVRAGLAPGMSLADARAVVPGVVARPADPAADALALERLARWADRFTPRVMPDGADTLFLDIAGCTRLFGGEASLTASLRAALEAFGLTVRLALADTPGAAWALAHHGAEDPAGGAGRHRDVRAEGCRWPRLPVAALRLSADIANALASFGLDRIRVLSAMEPVKLIRRFGVEPVRRLDQALGRLAEPIVPLRPPPPRRAHRAFAEPISTTADIRAAVDGLLDDLCLALSRSGEGARRLRLVCHRADRRRPAVPHHRHQSSAAPEEAPPGALRREAGPGRARFRHRRDRPGRRCGRDRRRTPDRLVRRGRGRMPRRQRGRAGGPPRPAGEPLRLRPHRPSGAAPELAARARRPQRGHPARTLRSPAPDRHRPLRLLCPPEPVEIVAAKSGTDPHPGPSLGPDGIPIVAFRLCGRLHRIRAVEGPECLECEWWREEAPRRDYYVVEDEAGHRHWLYREAAREVGRSLRRDGAPDAGPTPRRDGVSRWFLHGVFA